MNLKNFLIGVSSLLFFMIGADKFLFYLEPPCSLMDTISPIVWKGLGVLQLAAGILLWFPKFTRFIAGFFTVFMLVFSIVHLTQNTYDIGGAATMALQLGLLAWNPSFINGKDKK